MQAQNSTSLALALALALGFPLPRVSFFGSPEASKKEPRRGQHGVKNEGPGEAKMEPKWNQNGIKMK